MLLCKASPWHMRTGVRVSERHGSHYRRVACLKTQPCTGLAWSASPGQAAINLRRPPRPRPEMQALGLLVGYPPPLALDLRGQDRVRCGTQWRSAHTLSTCDVDSGPGAARRRKHTKWELFLVSPIQMKACHCDPITQLFLFCLFSEV